MCKHVHRWDFVMYLFICKLQMLSILFCCKKNGMFGISLEAGS